MAIKGIKPIKRHQIVDITLCPNQKFTRVIRDEGITSVYEIAPVST